MKLFFVSVEGSYTSGGGLVIEAGSKGQAKRIAEQALQKKDEAYSVREVRELKPTGKSGVLDYDVVTE